MCADISCSYKDCVNSISDLIIKNQESLEKREYTADSRTIASQHDFSSHLLFVSNYKEKSAIQTRLLEKSNNKAIIYPKIITTSELPSHSFLFESYTAKKVCTFGRETNIIDIVMLHFKKCINSFSDFEFIISKLHNINLLLKYKTLDEIFDSYQDELSWMVEFLKDQDLRSCEEIIKKLPAYKNQIAAEHIDFSIISKLCSHIYQLILYGENNLVHEKLRLRLGSCNCFQLIEQQSGKNKAMKNTLKFEGYMKFYRFQSRNYYEEALGYIINSLPEDALSKQTTSQISIICDDETLARRLFSYFKSKDIKGLSGVELRDYLNCDSDEVVRCFLQFTKLVFKEQSVVSYLDFINNPLLGIFDESIVMKNLFLHGKEFKPNSLKELLDFFEKHYSETLSTEDMFHVKLFQIHKIMLETYQKLRRQNSSFLTKFMSLCRAFEELLCKNSASFKMIYKLQEKAYTINLTHCSDVQFLSIVEYLAYSIKMNLETCDETTEHATKTPQYNKKIKIIKSTNIYDAHNSDVLCIALLDIDLHEKILSFLDPNHDTQYVYDPLSKLEQEIKVFKNTIIFHNENDFKDEIALTLLGINPKSTDAKYSSEQNLEEIIVDTFEQKLESNSECKEQEFFQKPKGLHISSIYVTALKRLINDPADYFIQDVLRIRPIDDFNCYSYKKEFGNICHKALDIATRSAQVKNLKSVEVEAIFRNSLWSTFEEEALSKLNEEHYLTSVANLDKIERNVINSIEPNADEVFQEEEIEHRIEIKNKEIKLKARADRIEKNENKITVIDYKTGVLPSIASIKNFSAPQMIAEAYIISKKILYTNKINVKLIKVNSNTRPCIEFDATNTLGQFEAFVYEILEKYIVQEDAKF